MIRKTLTILSLIGLLLSLGLWVVSYFTLHFQLPVRDSIIGGCLLRGSVDWVCSGPTSPFYGERRSEFWFEGFDGHTVWRPHVTTAPDYLALIIPLWIPTILFGMAFSFLHVLPRLRRRKRKKLGLCLKCGYDLRGSKERCPECGTAFEEE